MEAIGLRNEVAWSNAIQHNLQNNPNILDKLGLGKGQIFALENETHLHLDEISGLSNQAKRLNLWICKAVSVQQDALAVQQRFWNKYGKVF